MEALKRPEILWVINDKTDRKQLQKLSLVFHYLRGHFKITIHRLHEESEEEIIRIQKETPYPLILAPWQESEDWIKLEAYLGMNRTRGATLATYFTQAIPLESSFAKDRGTIGRRILLDCDHLKPVEVAMILKTLVDENQRSGIQPLLNGETQIYCENWYGSQGLGNRIDKLLQLPEIVDSSWNQRVSSVRILATAFWSLIYEVGPGKTGGPLPSETGPTPAIAYFQFAADEKALVMRLFYTSPSQLAPQDLVRQYWWDTSRPTSPHQLLLKYADLTRVHLFPESNALEITSVLLPSAPAEKDHLHWRSLWIEPLSYNLLHEPPFESPNPKNPRLKLLHTTQRAHPKLKAITGGAQGPSPQTAKRLISESADQIRSLKTKVQEQSEKIRELRSGGVGTSAPLTPPEAEDLISAFQERYFDAKFQIRQFQIQLETMEKEGAKAFDIQMLRQKMEALENRERAWIRRLMATLNDFRETLKEKKDPKK